ncbi:hypothetical protein Agabi119p4_7564 [Agaricus bisporus var. burnettii]|uniref:Nucleolar protein 12 n=1 Tax=Agaricus bisporus var. burnettii TaxID=192524 RepID=A0A8H7EZ58_AGABI|nr:hypothetical protein Agabi119p4_7564 [Agaricus bisporus var. burnettii]
MLSSLLLKKTTNVDSELDALFKSHPTSDVTPITTKKRKIEAQPEVAVKRTKPTLDSKPKKQKSKEQEEKADASDLHGKEVDEDDNDSEADSSTLIHESLTDKSKSKSGRGSKQKYVPSDETPAQKDRRTIFVGNLPLQVAQKRPMQKQFQRHILSFIPSAKIESTRFRSVPFKTPTSNLSSSTTTTSDTSTHKNPSQRDHDRTRASSWKTKESTDDPKPDEKQFLNTSQKKRIAFINQEFHSTAATVHAYIVFAYPIPQDSRPKNLPPLDPVMDPFVAAKEVVKKADGSVFIDRIIRVDSVGEKAKIGATADGEEEGEVGSFSDADPKCTLFVGNLDFTSEEGDLRLFFENLMTTERGDPPPRETDEESTEKKPHTWVKRVRIIKDKETQLGKGFAYVQFIDRECVDTLLTFSPDQLKFAKRKLRVNKCKTIQGSKLSSAIKSKLSQSSTSSSSKSQKEAAKSESKHASQSKKPPRTTTTTRETVEIPKGDPSLGTKLAHLSKDQRKQAKASDADRVARRLAKKKARMNMGSTDSSIQDPEKKHRRRERVRKATTTTTMDGAGAGGKKKDLVKKKGRVRSEKSLEKRNMKK